MSIIMYTKEGCPWCNDLRSLFQSKGVVFEERECRNNEKNFQELVTKSGQSLTPTLDIDGEIIADTDAPAIEALFKERSVAGF